ncbi:MAG: porin family protein [Deltaproteobacteria bacterium]|nr:porin family protein [Deltaproteobacteria bacterium]MCB9788171.1 porin family protein [Deltaproteobacteria bacterium]
MPRLIARALLALSLVLGLTGAAFAHPAPYPHYHPRPRPRPRPPVVIVQPPPPVHRTVVVQRPAPVVERVRVVEREPEPEPMRQRLGIGVRVSGIAVSGEKIGLSDGENSTMGGIGLQFRSRFSGQLGIELSADILKGGKDSFDQRTIPIIGALTYHFLPSSRIQPYLLAGAGVQFTRLSYLDGRYTYNMTEIAGQLGAGLEVWLGKRVSLQADVRGQTIFKNVDTHAEIRTDCLRQVGELTGFCDGIHAADPNDKMNVGLQFQLGANIYF